MPSGLVYAPMSMETPPWERLANRSLGCTGEAALGDLGVHPTSDACLSHVDIGLEYRWYPGVNVAVWRGDTNQHCYLCKLSRCPTVSISMHLTRVYAPHPRPCPLFLHPMV